MRANQASFFIRNGLSIAFVVLTLLSLSVQFYTGWKVHNETLLQYGKAPKSLGAYATSGHFLQATFENWESEFLQMGLFVVFTIFLYQKGSSESKKVGVKSNHENELDAKPDSPWPLKKRGWILSIYKHSLSLVLFMLFILSFIMHAYGSWIDFNEQQLLQHQPPINLFAYLLHSKLWFESFQNWQSEFLSVFAIVFLSIYLRQAGSSQSKAVNAPHSQTGN